MINLFCLPFAGGNKYSYRPYEMIAPSFLNIISLEYSEGGKRFRKSLISGMKLLVEDLLNFHESVLRADIKACETFIYEEMEPLSVLSTVIAGVEEDIEPEGLYSFKNETNTAVDFKQLSGNHFFIFKYPHKIMKMVSVEVLSKI